MAESDAPGEITQSEETIAIDWSASSAIQELTEPSGVAECPFCEASDDSLTPFDVAHSLGEGNVILKPTLGMLMPGYLLSITTKHLTSFAQLEPDALSEIDQSLTGYERTLTPEFGDYFRFEHGSDEAKQCSTGACIDHAHQHLVPDVTVADHIQEQLPWQQLDNFAELADLRGEPYLYMGRPGSHFVVPNPDVPSQWVRRQIAEVRGLEVSDWAIYFGAKELAYTFLRLIIFPFPYGRMILDPANDTVTYERRARSRLEAPLRALTLINPDLLPQEPPHAHKE